MYANAELFAFQHKEKTTRDIIVMIPGYVASICDITSKSVCLTIKLAIVDPYQL